MRFIYLLIACLVLAADQITKAVILARFSPDSVIPVIPGAFNFVRVENRGVAFGFMNEISSSFAFLLIVLVSIVAMALILYLLWKLNPAAKRAGIAFGLILGGATGNLADRLIRGRVVDFLDFYFRSYHWPAFNVADSAIVVGAGLLALDLFLKDGLRRSSQLTADSVPPGSH